MTETLTPSPLPVVDTTATAAPPAEAPARRHGIARVWRGRPEDPTWVRPLLLALLAFTAGIYLWGLGASGWANSYYSAAVQAGTHSWKAWFFGSLDSGNSITVDKSPAALWVMVASARVLGVNAWSILVPQALMGVAAVGVLYLAVRRWFTPAAGLLAGFVMALTPIGAVMFRYNNPDALLVLLLVIGAYAMTRAVEDGRTAWIVLAFSMVGFGFLAKMLQALLVVPAFGLVYLLAGPPKLGRRIWQLFLGGIALLVSAGWWIAIVELWPKSSRPYIGGSTNNSVLDLIFGYNGFGRLTGNETGSVGGGPAGQGGRWGPTGWTRLFNSDYGGQASWLIPAALILLVAGLLLTLTRHRTDRARAGLVLWGGWLVVTGLAFSFGQGIIHSYYTVALGPAIGALVGMGVVSLWRRGDALAFGILAGTVGVTVMWSAALLDRAAGWDPWVRTTVLLLGGLGVALLLAAPFIGLGARRAAIGIAGAAALLGPLAWTLATVDVPHAGAIPSAGPAGYSRAFGPGGRGGPGGGPGGANGFPGFGGQGRTGNGNGFPGFGGQGGTGGFPGFGGQGGTGGFPGFGGQGGTGNGNGNGMPGFGGPGGMNGGPGGGMGGLLNGSTPSAALTKILSANASKYTWVAATTGANQAAGYQLATDEAVMAIGGFNGTDQSPTLRQFQQWVSQGRIHYYIAGGGGPGGAGGPGGFGSSGTQSTSSQISSWVQQHFTAKTVGGVTLYDLTQPTSGSSTTTGSIADGSV